MPPRDRRMLELAWVQQPDATTCAPTAVRMMLCAFGVDISVDALKFPTGWTSDAGANRYGVARALNGFQPEHTYRISNTGDATRDPDLTSEIRRRLRESARRGVAAGCPIAVAVAGRLPDYLAAVDHWVVVAGIEDDRVLVLDPTARRHGFELIPPVRWVAIDQIPVRAFVA